MTDINSDVLDKIQKLLRMANDKRGNESEAGNAMRLAQRLADAHNLQLANIDPNNENADSKRREVAKKNGGLYKWQRALWKAVAEVNHCVYWTLEEEDRSRASPYWAKKIGAAEAKAQGLFAKTFRHKLLGSQVNVITTQIMSDYLQGTIERLARDYVGNDAKRYYIPDAIAYREGMAERIIDRLKEQRAADDLEQRTQKKAAQDRGDGSSLMIIDDVSERENEANWDFQYGAGSWKRIQDDRKAREAKYAEQREALAEAQRVQDEWDAANPVEAAKRRAEEAAESAKFWADYHKQAEKAAEKEANRKPRYRQMTQAEQRASSSGYYAGSRDGASVSLNKQVDSTKNGGLLK